MSDNSNLSPSTLIRDLGINVIVGFAGSVLSGLTIGKGWVVYVISFVVFFGAVFLVWIFRKYKPVFKMITSGFAGYFPEFGSEENAEIRRTMKGSFYYLGISCDSIMENWRQMFLEHPNADYRILMLLPDSDAVVRQVAFELGYGFEQKIADLRLIENVANAVTATNQRIRSAVALFKTQQTFKDKHLQIKYYNEFTPWWMYCVDGGRIYVGILKKGTRGSESAVILMKQNEKVLTMFNAFQHHWQRLWEEATPV